MTASLVLRDVSVQYEARAILKGVSTSFAAGELVGLIGPNGAGKTTLLRACASLIPLSGGEIVLNETPLARWDRRARARIMGYLAQERAVLWPLSAERLVALGRLPHLGPWDTLSDADQAAVSQAMTATDVLHLATRPVTALSGGELTRVLIARLLAGAPEVLLADEPVSGLDPAHAMQVLDIFRSLARGGHAVIVVLHDLTLAARYCDRLVLLDGGRVAADGAPLTVLTPDRLAASYGITADILNHGDAPLIIPRAQVL